MVKNQITYDFFLDGETIAAVWPAAQLRRRQSVCIVVPRHIGSWKSTKHLLNYEQ